MYTVISTHDIRKHWTAVSILWGLINNLYRDLHAWRTETIDRCYNLIMSHQQCIPSSPRRTYGNYWQMLQSYYVSSTMYTVITTNDIRKHWTAVSILLRLINNVYRDLHAWHTETIHSCFNLIRSHQQCTPWSPRTTDGNYRQMLQSYFSHQQCIPSSPRMTYGNCRQMLQSYYVSSTMYTVISTHDIRKL